MAHSKQLKSQVPAPQLYLVTPQIEDVAAFTRELAVALDAADIAAVLLRLAQADERSQINIVKALAPLVQGKGVALLLDGHADIVARGGADGAHLTGIETFSASLDTLKPARIAGCAGLATRHDAMTAAERGADYVMFGDAADGRRPSFDSIVERVAWWAEVFEVPCVGLAASLDEVGPLAAAGADFVAVGEFVWADPRGVAAALASAAKQLAAPETVA
jgi:thiamine-phosphate pyrophosphorylase